MKATFGDRKVIKQFTLCWFLYLSYPKVTADWSCAGDNIVRTSKYSIRLMQRVEKKMNLVGTQLRIYEHRWTLTEQFIGCLMKRIIKTEKVIKGRPKWNKNWSTGSSAFFLAATLKTLTAAEVTRRLLPLLCQTPEAEVKRIEERMIGIGRGQGVGLGDTRHSGCGCCWLHNDASTQTSMSWV